MNHTWLPSQTGPMLFRVTRRSSSSRATKGSCAATPRSKPSIRAKPVSSTARNSHQIRRRISYSFMASGLPGAQGAAFFGCEHFLAEHLHRSHQDVAPHQVEVHHRERRIEDDESEQAP